jgi:hypothetical protein
VGGIGVLGVIRRVQKEYIYIYIYIYMGVGVMRDSKVKLRDLNDSHTLGYAGDGDTYK